MRVTIVGMYIPNTNVWEVEDDWTAEDLLADIVKIITAKTGNPEEYSLIYNGGTIQSQALICDELPENCEITIRWR